MQKREEFISLIKTNEGILYKIAKLYMDDLEDQKDLYQETVFQLWKSFETFEKKSKISTWVYRVALNTAISQLKKEKKRKTKISLDSVFIERLDHIDTIMDERITLLYEHIKKLSLVEKGIILLFLEGKNYKEIGEVTGFSETNIGTRMSRIKQKLKTEIKK